jgi:hypothetical protein
MGVKLHASFFGSTLLAINIFVFDLVQGLSSLSG